MDLASRRTHALAQTRRPNPIEGFYRVWSAPETALASLPRSEEVVHETSVVSIRGLKRAPDFGSLINIRTLTPD
jgi:hypothetical protein